MRKKVTVRCDHCGNSCEKSPHHIAQAKKRNYGIFCDRKCYGLNQRAAAKRRKREITPELLHELFIIDFVVGSMKWRKRSFRGRQVSGNEAGYVHTEWNGRQYRKIPVCGKLLKRARLMYFAYHAEWPMPMVDHFNRDSLDDSISNLRPATRGENNRNTERSERNLGQLKIKTGVQPVTFGRFRASVKVNNKSVFLGYYKTPEAAREIYLAKRKELYGRSDEN